MSILNQLTMVQLSIDNAKGCQRSKTIFQAADAQIPKAQDQRPKASPRVPVVPDVPFVPDVRDVRGVHGFSANARSNAKIEQMRDELGSFAPVFTKMLENADKCSTVFHPRAHRVEQMTHFDVLEPEPAVSRVSSVAGISFLSSVSSFSETCNPIKK
jgi:hypothetical protein